MPEPRRHTVLVVNDDDAGRYSVARMLKADGFDVVEAATGEDGLRRARDLPDLVLLDVNLPDISGREVCAHLKADPWTARLPVVHLSATYVGSDHIAEGLEGGADAYLTQPVDPRELVATLRAVLRLGELERELHDKAVLLDAVVQGSLDAIYVKDLQGRYLLFNRAAEAVTGKPAAEVIGRDDTVLFPADEAAVVMRTDREIVWGGETRQVDEHVTGADGELHHFVTTKGPLLDADGRAYACFGIAHDVTQLRNADAQARRLNDELESRVERRTAELARANRELEQFVYSMAHDLRTPLRAIAGFTQLVAEDKAAQLDEGGRADLAWAVASQRDYPSWGDWIRQGATTLWESWEGDSSRIHHMFSDVSGFFYKEIAGLKPDEADPGFRTIRFAPHFAEGLSWAEAWHETPFGRTAIRWDRLPDARIQLRVEVPDGASAALRLPDGETRLSAGIHALTVG